MGVTNSGPDRKSGQLSFDFAPEFDPVPEVEPEQTIDGWADHSDEFTAKPVRSFGVTYQHPEHARWAAFFALAKQRFAYQPRHFGLSVDCGIRPAYYLHGVGWFHVACRYPSQRMRYAAQLVATTTGDPVTIALGTMQVLPDAPWTMPMLHTAGRSHEVWRHWTYDGHRLVLRPDTSHEIKSAVGFIRAALQTTIVPVLV